MEVNIEIFDEKTTELLKIYPEEADGGSRWSVWTMALIDGLITLDFYEQAKSHFGDLWLYTRK
ncbi:MAG: hypothetical protein K0S61_101 [Anaerocolumna sp.]|jgi:hypothetical protein|nr:hypothetical protein [Anaerocolumna sp.]